MNWKAVLFVALLVALAWPRAGHAEKIKTNQSAKLYSRAGEQSPIILTLPSGQAMTLLAKDGRWIKVRVSGRTGWLPRSKVDLPEEEDEIARNTRRRPFVDGRGTRRGFGGEGGPDDRVGADAVGEGDDADDKPARRAPRRDDSAGRKAGGDDDDEQVSVKEDGAGGDGEEATRPVAHVAKATTIYVSDDAGSGTAFTAQPRTALFVVEEKGKWTFVENDEGDAGFVQTSKLDVEQSTGPRRRIMGGRARIGVALLSQSLETPGGTTTVPENYTARSSSVTVALGGEVLYPYKKRYWVGGELTYDYDRAVPGISYMTKSTGFSYHNLNLRAVGGYELQKPAGWIVFARLGLHYDSFQIAGDVANFTENPAKIPNQIITAPILGGAVMIPRLTPKLALKVSLDTILVGASVSQTKNLEDGTDPSAKAVFLGGVLTYRWKPKMDLQFTYDLAYTSISFGGLPPATSQRGHTGTAVRSGSDVSNTLTGGITYAF